MRAMTIGTGRRDDEAALQQAASMHAVLVTADDIGDVRLDTRGGLFADPMARTAELRDLTRIGRR